jgi:hypothetical protein
MTICYGPFLLGRLPLEAIETEAQCLDALERFARLGFCLMFREIIKDRVVEFRFDSKTRTVTHRWLEGEEADLVHHLDGRGNCAPASWLETIVGIGPILAPKVRRIRYGLSGDISLELATGHIVEFNASGAYDAEKYIRHVKNRVKRETDEEFASYHDSRDSRDELINFYDELLLGIERCRKAGILYILGDFYIRQNKSE